MLTRQDILNDYDVDQYGTICSPGKFEGEPVYAVYFWECYLNGFSDDDTDGVLTFDVTDEDRKEFPELAYVKQVLLEESDNGFVYSLALV